MALMDVPAFAELFGEIQRRVPDVALVRYCNGELRARLAEAPPPTSPRSLEDAALPSHLERMDPTWLAHDGDGNPLSATSPALATLPPPQREAVGQLLGSPSPTSTPPRWLALAVARRCWAHLVDLPPEGPRRLEALPKAGGPGALASALPSVSADELRGAITALGVAPFGGLLSRVPRRAAAATCARLPDELRDALWSARSRAEHPPSGRTQLAALQAEHQHDPAALLFALGARPLAAFLAHHAPWALRQCAQLLPLPAARLLKTGDDAPLPSAEAIRSAFGATP